MQTFVAFFRGINVGGAHLLPMKELVAILETAGCKRVKTYIQSGNAVFRHRAAASTLARKIRAAIGEAKGFEPEVQLLSQEQIEQATSANPFSEGEADPSKLHLYFLATEPEQPDLDALEALCTNEEEYELSGGVFYLYAPAGIGRSKLANKVEKSLGVSTTARNWRTVQKVLTLAQECDESI